ncbi:MAG TPA: nitronate monooxygenase, partial [Geminicoccaceae bacterium]|nr:nitronate monooxygenase [Geminicoccaceae bacterium]
MWPRTVISERLGLAWPLIQAPMASAATPELAAAVSEAGGLGSLGCANLPPDELRAQIRATREATSRSFNVNFFCHEEPAPDPERDARMRARLAPFYQEFGIEPPASARSPRPSFHGAQLEVLLEERPPVVSFHF